MPGTTTFCTGGLLSGYALSAIFPVCQLIGFERFSGFIFSDRADAGNAASVLYTCTQGSEAMQFRLFRIIFLMAFLNKALAFPYSTFKVDKTYQCR